MVSDLSEGGRQGLQELPWVYWCCRIHLKKSLSKDVREARALKAMPQEVRQCFRRFQ